MVYCVEHVVLDMMYTLDVIKCTCALRRTCVTSHINVILNIVFIHTNVEGDIILFTYIILDIARGIHDEMQTSNLTLQNVWMSTLMS